ncbi:PREDICTED: seipin [Polistes canadensis]|uniref:seipin n=1 Tax=Polistes canadensis TaxID=91411 RepID=UPI000718D443|nr:PREDICTED: seipin [Polistes canadensis]
MLISRSLQQIIQKWLSMQKKTTRKIRSVKDAVFRGGIIISSAILIVWLSVFLYIAFYYAYMPSMSYMRPIHLQFQSCNNKRGMCNFPSAMVELTKKQSLFMVGQPYKINLHLEMPESPVNKELGMFMVCARLHSRNAFVVERVCRSAMLHYRSTLLHTLSTLIFSPMMISGTTEEKQTLVLELFGNFEEDQSRPVTLVHVEIESRFIEFYSALLVINAHLSGLRYLMYHWPILSAIIGIGTNLFFLALISILSHLHFAMEEEDEEDDYIYEIGESEEEKDIKTLDDSSLDTLSLEDVPVLEDIPQPHEESHSSHPSDPILGEPSYIQEISTLIAESSAVEFAK